MAKLKPRKAKYDNKKHGHSDSRIPGGCLYFNPEAKVELIQMDNNKHNYFRPWPALQYEDPSKLAPGRYGPDPNELSHFMIRVPVAAYIGTPDSGKQVSFCLYEPWEREDRKRTCSYGQFYWNCKKAYDNSTFAGSGAAWDGSWNPLMKGKTGKGAPIPKPKAVWMLQGTIYQKGDKMFTQDRDVPLGMHKDDSLPVVVLSGATGEAINQLFSHEARNPKGDTEKNPAALYRYKDPVGRPKSDGSVPGGWVFQVFNPKNTTGPSTLKEHSSWNGQIGDYQSYEVALSRSYTTRNGTKLPAALTAEQADVIKSKWKYWFPDEEADDPGIIRFPSEDEKVLLIAKAFSDVPRLVQYALADNPALKQDEVQGVLKARRSAMVPGSPEDDPENLDDVADDLDPDVEEDGVYNSDDIDDIDDEFDEEGDDPDAEIDEVEDEDEDVEYEDDDAIEEEDVDEVEDDDDVEYEEEGEDDVDEVEDDDDVEYEDEEEEGVDFAEAADALDEDEFDDEDDFEDDVDDADEDDVDDADEDDVDDADEDDVDEELEDPEDPEDPEGPADDEYEEEDPDQDPDTGGEAAQAKVAAKMEEAKKNARRRSSKKPAAGKTKAPAKKASKKTSKQAPKKAAKKATKKAAKKATKKVVKKATKKAASGAKKKASKKGTRKKSS